MKKYTMSARVLGMPVFCGTIDAAAPAEARKAWEAKFWSAVDELRAAMSASTMDELNRTNAEKMIALMEARRADARQYGLVVTARLSRGSDL